VNASAPKGIVLNIQHFSTHDGPGMRCAPTQRRFAVGS
jgi:hypothetical protein